MTEHHPLVVKMAKASLREEYRLPDVTGEELPKAFLRHLRCVRAALTALRDLTPDAVEAFYAAGADLTGDRHMAEHCWSAIINHLLGE